MKIATFADANGVESWGAAYDDHLVDVPRLASTLGVGAPAGVTELLRSNSLDEIRKLIDGASRSSLESASLAWSDVTLAAPVPRPGKVIAIGRNYLDHAGEASLVLPKWPKLFPKFPSTVVGSGHAVVRPTLTQQLDFEVEVAVVIGKTARGVTEAKALDYVAGYTVINDISARDLQFADEQLTLGKNFDTFCPMGPVLTTKDELPDPAAIGLRLRLNGELMQESTTANLIFSIPYLVSFVSYVVTLEPGDVIATGTPAGVGCFRSPPVWLQAGDRVEAEVDGVGTLVNSIVDGVGVAPERTSPH